MANKRIIVIFIVILIGISLIISIPVLTLSSGLLKYARVDELLTFEYVPDNFAPIEGLNLNVDKGDVEIRYINPPVDYCAKIEVLVEMSGANLAGKSYSDFFDIDWQNNNSPANFSMEYKSDVDESKVLSLIKNITIVINFRADIIFDIIATVKEGNVQVNVPYRVSVNNLVINTTKGDILYDLNHCILEGNITGIANDGNIDLVAYNPEYTRNTLWTYNSNAGDITIDINHNNQHNIMNANITGSLVGNEFGDIIVYYYDNTANIGAMITLNDTLQNLSLGRSSWVGFEKIESFEGIPYVQFTSTDFPTINNYNLLLEGLTLNKGIYEVLLSSS
ncbi:MAG: hypothetical protein ACW98D_09395 [Promethearchaeota archaeon]|jgi:hypothetical protein